MTVPPDTQWDAIERLVPAADARTTQSLDAGRTRLVTETRSHATDAVARRRFSVIWPVISPFAAMPRQQVLLAVRPAAESSARASPPDRAPSTEG